MNEIQHYVVNYIYMIFNNIKKFIFPSRCIICDAVLPYGNDLNNEYLCDNCKLKLEFVHEPTCKKCGAMIDDENCAYCTRCENSTNQYFEFGFGLLRYNEFVKESLHKVKYYNRKEYLNFYGKCIAKYFVKKFKEINPDYLVPVPIHKSRLIKRNFNQASVLAHAISEELNNYGITIPVNEQLVFRVKNTKALNKLDNADRTNELSEAFKANDLSNIDSVILVDDIYTTGSTINEISKVIKNAGISHVYFSVISVLDNL